MSEIDATEEGKINSDKDESQEEPDKITKVNISKKDSNIWPEILRVMYNSGGIGVVSVESSDTALSKAVTPLYDQIDGISTGDFSSAIQLMERADLVEQSKAKGFDTEFKVLKLTKRGFEVAHERELAEKQQESNENIAFFTLILAFTAILQTITAALQLNQLGTRIGILLIVLAITLLTALYNSQPREWLERLRGTFR